MGRRATEQLSWALLSWIIGGVGGEWQLEDLNATGRLYQVSAAGAGGPYPQRQTRRP
jgi:hypothetical protein